MGSIGRKLSAVAAAHANLFDIRFDLKMVRRDGDNCNIFAGGKCNSFTMAVVMWCFLYYSTIGQEVF